MSRRSQITVRALSLWTALVVGAALATESSSAAKRDWRHKSSEVERPIGRKPLQRAALPRDLDTRVERTRPRKPPAASAIHPERHAVLDRQANAAAAWAAVQIVTRRGRHPELQQRVDEERAIRRPHEPEPQWQVR